VQKLTIDWDWLLPKRVGLLWSDVGTIINFAGDALIVFVCACASPFERHYGLHFY
jgi:hypothetical protein